MRGEAMSTRRLAVASLTLVLLAAAGLAGTASASTRSHAAASSSFCSASKSIAEEIASIAGSTSSAQSFSQLGTEAKAELTSIKQAEPGLKSTVPKRLKHSLAVVLNLVNVVYTEYSAAGWNLLKLGRSPQAMGAIEKAQTGVTPASDALRAYYRKTCKFKV
jgi:hypothetical protein